MLRFATMSRYLLATARLVVAIHVLSSSVSHAAEMTTTQVEDLIGRGNALRRSGRDQEALPLYQKAYDIAATPRTAAQLGLCEMALNYWLAADVHLAESLRGRGDWIDRNRRTIELAHRQVGTKLGALTVSGSPTGATVVINGKPAGTLPLRPVRVVAGDIRVVVTAPGHRNLEKTVSVSGEGQELFIANLAPEVNPASVNARLEANATPEQASLRWGSRKITGLVLVGVGVASIALGVVVLKGASERCDAPAGAVCDRAPPNKTPGWIAVGGGLATGILGGVLFVTGSDTDSTARHSRLLSIGGSF